jgi:hypothetical protein
MLWRCWEYEVVRHSLLFLTLLIFRSLPVQAQTFQFLPEVDTHFKVNSEVRVYFQVKETKEGGAPTQAELGLACSFTSSLG